MISDEILSAWMGSPRGYGREISSVAKAGYIAWSLKTELSCGVAVPFEDGEPVHEEFARVLLESTEIYLGSGERVRVLALTSSRTRPSRQCVQNLFPQVQMEHSVKS